MAQKKQGVNWDLASYFPSFDGPEMRAFKKKLASDVAAIQRKAAKLPPLSARTANDWEKVILAAENAGTRLGHLFSYVGCLGAAHADNEAYSAEEARLA
ncbi:MAG: hypothetical protein RQ748_12830, partial [Elusimicrobiales bacterium]|nr:hypothetical protein [Elusimicrobiales bacterium]